MTNKEKMHTGELYLPDDKSILVEQGLCLARLKRFNKVSPVRLISRQKLMKKMFAEIGENCYIESPIHSNFGCKNIHFGKNIY